jgi:hypothetical protein
VIAEFASNALILAAILASTVWTEWRTGAALRSLRTELVELRLSIFQIGDRLSALESRKNGAYILGSAHVFAARPQT